MGYFPQTIDAQIPLKDAGAVATTAPAQVGGVAQILDIGAGFVRASALINVTTSKTTALDESYTLAVQGSNDSAFASGNVNLAIISLGAAAVTNGGTITTPGFFPVPFSNFRNGVLYRYIRAHHTISGTAPSINYTSYVTKE